MKLKSVFILALGIIAGQSGWSRPFPLCLYGVNRPEDVKIVKKAGFSCLQTYVTAPDQLASLAKAAQKQGLQVVFDSQEILGSSYEKKAASWPILAWYLVDEPDVQHWSRKHVKQVHQNTKQAFPHHLTTLVIGQGKTKVPYYDIPDTMMVDWYPVPHLPLVSFAQQVDFVRKALIQTNQPDKPVWGVVQAFDWKEYKQYRPDNDRIGRFPTVEELRFMSYQGIVNGADGLFYFIFYHQNNPLPQSSPDYWKRLKTVVKELAQFKKIIEKGNVAENPVAVQTPFQMKTWHYQNHFYSVFINTSDSPQPVPQTLQERSYKIVYGPKKQSFIAPYSVWILKK